MPTPPPPVRQLLQELDAPEADAAYLEVDAAGVVASCGGPLAAHGLAAAVAGRDALEVAPFLVGVLPLADRPFRVAPVELVPERWSELHLLPGDEGRTWVVLVDCSDRARARQRRQQRGNELALERERHRAASPGSAAMSGLYAHVVSSLGIAIFVHTREHRFSVETVPHWLGSLIEGVEPGAIVDLVERFPFLEAFLPEAESVWEDPIPGVETSGIWVEPGEGGVEIPLEALATRSQSDRLLLLRIPWAEYEEKRELQTRARSSTLEHDRLRKEVQKKEILLHCIVHDLSNPLSGIKGAFELLARRELPPDALRHVQMGLQMCADQQRLIASILDTFSAELSSPASSPLDPALVVDAATVLRKVVETFLPVSIARQRNLRIAPSCLRGQPSLRAAIDGASLERMLLNLTENALRHTPAGGTVTLGAEPSGSGVRFTVDDDGPGVPEEQAAQLFEKFRQGPGQRGTAGLGLYFCKITSERWGGEIGHENRAGGGSRFWFRLPAFSGG